MDLLLLLRILTVIGQAVLLVVLVVLLATWRGAGRGEEVRRPAWVMIAWIHGIFAVAGLVVELQHFWLDGDIASAAVRKLTYNIFFLLNSALEAVLPALILAHFLKGTRYRRWSLAGVVLIVATGAAAGLTGAVWDWAHMLGVSQILSFQAIVGYLVFMSAYLLKRLPGVDVYLAVFLGVDAAFVLVLPIQQVFFQAVGPSGVWEIWHPHQLLQLMATGIQVAVVLSCINSMRYRRVSPLLRVLE